MPLRCLQPCPFALAVTTSPLEPRGALYERMIQAQAITIYALRGMSDLRLRTDRRQRLNTRIDHHGCHHCQRPAASGSSGHQNPFCLDLMYDGFLLAVSAQGQTSAF